MEYQEIKRCYGRAFGFLDQCVRCDVIEHCRNARDPRPIADDERFKMPTVDPDVYAESPALPEYMKSLVRDFLTSLCDPDSAGNAVAILGEFSDLASSQPTAFRIVFQRLQRPRASLQAIAEVARCSRGSVRHHLRRVPENYPHIAEFLRSRKKCKSKT